jgi:hypothetical protein
MLSRRLSIEAGVGGAIIGVALFAAIGFRSGNGVFGGTAGGILGAIVGICAYRGLMHRVTVGAILYALFACILGPAVDDYGGAASLPFACIGAFIGWLGWRYLLFLPTALVGGLVALQLSEPKLLALLLAAMWVGAMFYFGGLLERRFDANPGALFLRYDEPFETPLRPDDNERV